MTQALAVVGKTAVKVQSVLAVLIPYCQVLVPVALKFTNPATGYGCKVALWLQSGVENPQYRKNLA